MNIEQAIGLTKEYLRAYRYQRQYVANLAEDITYEENIYTRSVLAKSKDYKERCRKYIEANRLLEMLDDALARLPQIERVILKNRYIEREIYPWSAIAELVGYQEKSCYRLCDKGLRSVAQNIFVN